MVARLKALVLASGSGSIAQTVFDASKSGVLNWNSDLLAKVEDFAPDLILSLGFMRILDKSLLNKFKVINTHPSYLPNFPGAHAVKDALQSGVSSSGCTIHWVDEGVDTGEIIAQRVVPILSGDSESGLHERIKVEERALIIEVLRNLAL